MNGYTILRNELDDYDRYDVVCSDGMTYHYFEKKDNQFVNKVYIFVGEVSSIKFQEQIIYMFFKDLVGMEGIINILNSEFSNLEYVFILENDQYKAKIEELIIQLGISGKCIQTLQYLGKNSKNKTGVHLVNKQYDHYDLKDNIFIKGDDDEEVGNIKEDKTSIEYNGYNKYLISKNAGNIVSVRSSNGGDENEL